MTRDRIVKICRSVLRKHPDLDVDAVSIKIADAIEMTLELEALDQEDEPQVFAAESLTSVRNPGETVRLPSSPAVSRAAQPKNAKPLIIAPDSEEAREIVRAKTSRPIQPPPKLITAAAEEDLDKIWWRLEDLQTTVLQNTPETIEITIDVEDQHGPRRVPFKLMRNVVREPGLQGVQLSYQDPRVPDNLVITHYFDVRMKELDMDAVLEKVERSAYTVYAPKPRTYFEPAPFQTFTAAIPFPDPKSGEILYKYSPPLNAGQIGVTDTVRGSRANPMAVEPDPDVQDNRSWARKAEGV